jgi:hypothetical protein
LVVVAVAVVAVSSMRVGWLYFRSRPSCSHAVVLSRGLPNGTAIIAIFPSGMARSKIRLLSILLISGCFGIAPLFGLLGLI